MAASTGGGHSPAAPGRLNSSPRQPIEKRACLCRVVHAKSFSTMGRSARGQCACTGANGVHRPCRCALAMWLLRQLIPIRAVAPPLALRGPGQCDRHRRLFATFSFGLVNRSPLVICSSTYGGARCSPKRCREAEMRLPRGYGPLGRCPLPGGRWRSALKSAGLTFVGSGNFWRLFSAHALRHPP